MRRSVARLAAITGAFFLLGGAVAYACNEPSLGLGAQQAGPGDPVGFTIVNIEEGATWTVDVSGRSVASGTAAGGGSVSGTFTMPDLGTSSRSVYVTSNVAHEDSRWPSTRTMGYAPRPAPAAEAPAPQQQATPPQGGSAPAAPGARTPSQSPALEASPRQTDRARGLPRSTVGQRPRGTGPTTDRQASRPATRVSAAERAATRSATRPGSSSAGLTASKPTAAAATSESKRSEAVKRGAALTSDTPPETPAATSSRPSTEVTGPGTLLVGMALLTLVGIGVAAFKVIRGRGDDSADLDDHGAVPPRAPPDILAETPARDAAIEAELQRMITEERAKSLTGDDVHDDRPASVPS